MIGIVDYDMGNLKSVQKALEKLNIEYFTSRDVEELKKADKLIIPGVGAFKKAMNNLQDFGLVSFLRETKKPILGICLGMQILFKTGLEDGETEGLGLIEGKVIHIKDGLKIKNKSIQGIKIPHMGWNKVNGKWYYFVHSYYAMCQDEVVIGYADYGIKIPAIVKKDNVIGCQFHPEKSGEDGLEILKNFEEMM